VLPARPVRQSAVLRGRGDAVHRPARVKEGRAMRATRLSRRMVLGAAPFLFAPAVRGAQPGRGASAPVVLQVSSVAPDKNQRLSALVAEIRSQADAFV